jgi:hypothetical protein
MGQGFPTRVTRDALGPKLEDAYPVEHPTQEVGARTFNADFWQVAGMNLIVPRAVLIASWNGSAFDLHHQAEAWNPNGQQGRPTLARVGAGDYTYEFASTYADEDGTQQTLTLVAARVNDCKVLANFAARLESRAWLDGSNPLLVHVKLWDTGGSGADARFWLEVF